MIDFEAHHQRMWLKGECDGFPPDKWRLTHYQAGAASDDPLTVAYEKCHFELRDKQLYATNTTDRH